MEPAALDATAIATRNRRRPLRLATVSAGILAAMSALATVLANGTALADAGPYQASAFGQTPNRCAGRHRAHTGLGPKLLSARGGCFFSATEVDCP